MEKKNSTTKKSTTKSAAKKNIAAKKTTTTKNATKNKAAKKSPAKKQVVKKEMVNKPEVKETKKEVVATKVARKKSFGEKIKDLWANQRELSIAIIIIIVLVAIIVCLAFSKRVPKLKDGSSVVASIDGLTINSQDLYESLSNQYGTDKVISMIDEYIADKEVTKLTDKNKDYIKEVVDYYKQYAEYYGVSFQEFLKTYVGLSDITTEEEFEKYITKDYKKTLAVQKYVGEQLTDEEINKYYKENYSEKLTVKTILIEPDSEEKDTDKAKEEALNTAKDLIKQLDKVKDDSKKLNEKFEDLAYDNSADESYSDGGEKKDIMKKDVDEAFFEAAKKLKNGEYTAEPIETEYGYYIILKVSSKKQEELKDIKDEVIQAAAENKLSEDSTLQTTAWDELRKKYNLKINDSKMKSAYKKSLKTSTKSDSNSDSKDSSSSEEEISKEK